MAILLPSRFEIDAEKGEARRMQKLIQWLPLIAMSAVAALGAGTGMPWEAGLGTVGKSMTNFVAPTVAAVGGALALTDMIRHHGGGLSTMGQIGLYACIGGVGGTLWPAALGALGVAAACV